MDKCAKNPLRFGCSFSLLCSCAAGLRLWGLAQTSTKTLQRQLGGGPVGADTARAPPWACSFAGAAITNAHSLCGLHNRHFFCHSSGG